MPTFGMLFTSLLLVLALWWVKEMLGRWRADLEELRDPQTEWIPRLCLIGLWLVTLGIAFFAISFIIHTAIVAISGLRALL
ncbi:MAG: hypothetical protein ACP5I8_03165 [Phycisphaerae bacterium]